MTVYVKKEPWPAITEAVRSTTGQVLAVSGYVNKGAFDRLPLKAGDVLVCDISPATVATGASNPSAVIPFLKAGVKVFSKPGLHAKVVVLPKKAFVGSANASDNSATRLFEAVLETTSTADVKALRQFARDLCTSPVSTKSVHAVSAKYPKHPKQGSTATDPSKLPEQWEQVTVVGLALGEWSTQETTAWEKGDVAARDKAKNAFTGYTIIEFAWTSDGGSAFDEGQWVIQVLDGVPQPPGTVVHREKFGKREVIWLATPDESGSLPSLDDIKPRPPVVGELRVIRGKAAQRLLDLQRAQLNA